MAVVNIEVDSSQAISKAQVSLRTVHLANQAEAYACALHSLFRRSEAYAKYGRLRAVSWEGMDMIESMLGMLGPQVSGGLGWSFLRHAWWRRSRTSASSPLFHATRSGYVNPR
jgi:hypothetical protein